MLLNITKTNFKIGNTFATDMPRDKDKTLDISLAGRGPGLGAMFKESGFCNTEKIPS